MKIGLLAYSSDTGLGYQTREFYKNIPCEKVLIADLSMYNQMPVNHNWCNTDYRVCEGFPEKQHVEWLCEGVDIVFMCETPLNYYLFEYASSKGVKTIQQFNYEFLEYFSKPYLPRPTILAAPSKWNYSIVERKNFTKLEYLPVPIDTQKYQFRQLYDVKTFIHIAGRPAAHDRNGTKTFLDAAISLGKMFKYKIFLQRPKDQRALVHFQDTEEKIKQAKSVLGDNLQIIEDEKDNVNMYRSGEVLVLPRRYGGLCLPMLEAIASGLPVIMTNIEPNNLILPRHWLVESEIIGSFKAQTEIAIYEAKVGDLASKMLDCAVMIRKNNLITIRIAERFSWDSLKTTYQNLFHQLCGSLFTAIS